MGMKISKSIILPKITEIENLGQVSKLFHDFAKAIEEHNLVNYEDAVESARSMTFINSVANAGLTLINGGAITTNSILAESYHELRNTYVFNGDDSLDASFPFELDFEIVSEMTAIQKVFLSFRIREFRAYSKGAASGGGATSGASGTPSGGGATSGASGTPSGGGATSAGSNLGSIGWLNINVDEHGFIIISNPETYGIPERTMLDNLQNHTHTTPNHTHPNHVHTTPNHTHPNHAHTIPNHTHPLTFGIYEEAQSPTINVYLDNGADYGASIGSYNADQLDIDITAHISGTGFKRVKFTSNVRTRISAWVMCKVDLTA